MRSLVSIIAVYSMLAASHALAEDSLWQTYRDNGEREYAQGRVAEAERLFLAALREAEKFGPQDPRLARTLGNLGFLYVTQEQYAEAEPLLKRALTIRETALGPDHQDIATSLNNLAALYEAQGHSGQAQPLYLRALAVWEKALGPDHPHIATALSNLALHYEARKQYDLAVPLYPRMLAIWEKALGPDHPDVAAGLENYADLLRKVHRHEEADAADARAQAIRARQFQQPSEK